MSGYKSAINAVRNVFGLDPIMTGMVNTKTQEKHDINNRIIRLKLERIKQDIASWRQAISEAENAFYPNRLSMQRIFLDTALNGHVTACINKRKNLTLLKDFAFVNKKGVVNEELTELFKTQWFYDLLNYILDAQFYGYSYINWHEVKNNKLCGVQLIKRHNVSPDREMVLPFPNSFSGFSLFEEQNLNWSLWVPTNSENGISTCGYGLLNKVAPYEIYLRNLQGFNGTYVELFAQPFRHGKTDKTEGPERDEFEKAISDMGSSAYAITDPLDSIEFIDTGASGTGYKSYESFQERNEKTISKIILGHSDAIDSRAGKIGAHQGKESTVQLALNEIEATDTRFIEYVINDLFLEKLIALGFNIPADESFKLLNNKEDQAQKDALAEVNTKIAAVVKTLHDAGFKADAKWITEQTTIPLTEVEPPKEDSFTKDIQNKLKSIYGAI